MLELYNTTKDTKRIPKFNYNGKYVIKPHEAVDIQDDQAFFFKPYAKAGIVVRCKRDNTPRVAKEVKVTTSTSSVHGGFLDVGMMGNTVIETLSSPSYEEPEVPEVEVVENAEEAVEVSEPVEPELVGQKVYTDEELSVLGRDDLRDIAVSMGITEAASMGRKKDIKELILAKQG